MASLVHLLTTNQAPSDDERARLKETLAECDEKLNAITERISTLEAQLRSLNKEKAALLEASAPFRRALSPFRQLPEDVVRAIFVACLETRWNPTMANTEAPVLLTQISRATRMIALTTPELWAAIHIPITISVRPEVMDTAQSITTARAEGVEEWLLRRSGNHPLHISVNENSEHDGTHALTSRIIDILMACCFRWKNVYFSCSSATLSRISSLSQFDIPLLESLAISSWTDSDDEIDFWRNSDMLKSPALKRFRYLGRNAVLTFPVNWSNLTDLRFTANAGIMDNLARVLRQAVGLVRLDIVLIGYYWLPSSDTISLPRLTSLVVAEFSTPHPDANIGIFASIVAPSLEIISYNTNLDSGLRSPALIACLKRSTNIRELSMSRPSSLNILVEYLSHCPSLRILYITLVGYLPDVPKDKPENNAFLSAFVQSDPAQCLCPHLQYFRYEPTLEVSLPTLHNFLVRKDGTILGLSRWKAVVVNVKYDPVDEPLIKEIQSMEVVGNIRHDISFKETIPYCQNLDRGIVRVTSPVDDWWPSGVVDDMTYLS
ncbi:hypothetical protein HYPSUDRAFT_48769 [Hypholoma sublateritium FD-334 SS-4]|uniref:F-box domain-containing protein n=1 Tax=Hypholoma sublateritium (strain FD-334 SS-4) TaxID=945553 RepID=A0A0D2NE50_HYPSF|nr:hypothetical protein HYPSUDRAFT_48769 [Hypholoma sublateritium FD-334 SS-4]